MPKNVFLQEILTISIRMRIANFFYSSEAGAERETANQ